jgi:hypothetical protein
LPREEFLYDFKRRLRAARKRAVLAADHRGTRVVRNPRLAAARPRQALPGRLPFPPWGMVRRRRVGGVVNYRESSAGHRPRAFPRRARDPAPRRGPADLRCPVEEPGPRQSRDSSPFVRWPRVVVRRHAIALVQAGSQISATGMFGHLVQTATCRGPGLSRQGTVVWAGRLALRRTVRRRVVRGGR